MLFRSTLDSSGNLGLNNGNLSVTGSVTSTVASGATFVMRSGNSANYAYIDFGRVAGESAIGVAAGNNQFVIGSATGDTVFNTANGSSKIILGSTSNAILSVASTGVSVTGAISATAASNVTGPGGGGPIFTAANSQAVSGNLAIQATLANNNSNTSSYLFQGNTNGVAKGYIYGDGTFGSATSTYGAIISMREFKQDIVDASSQLADVKAAAAIMKKFRFKDDPEGPLQLGWIVDELQPICPGLIMESQLKDGTIRYGIKTSIAHQKAFKALGELIEVVEQQQKEIDELRQLIH